MKKRIIAKSPALGARYKPPVISVSYAIENLIKSIDREIAIAAGILKPRKTPQNYQTL